MGFRDDILAPLRELACKLSRWIAAGLCVVWQILLHFERQSRGPGPVVWLSRAMTILIVALVVGAAAFIVWRLSRERDSAEAARGDPVAMELERQRDSALWTAVAAPVCGGMLGAVLWLFGAGATWAVMAGVLVAALMLFWAWSFVADHGQIFKWNFVVRELAETFDDLEYDPDGVITEWDPWELGIFDTPLGGIMNGGRTKGNDLIRASYRGTRFEQCDVQLMHTWFDIQRDRNGNAVELERTLKIFSGRAMRIAFDEPFRTDVRVVSRAMRHVVDAPMLWREVRTELAGLDERYQIMARDPLDAMMVLGPRRTEAIHRLWEAARAPLALLFRDSSLFVFVALGHDPFEAGPWRTLAESRDRLRRDVRMIVGLLDAMRIDGQDVLVQGAAQGCARSRPADSAATATEDRSATGGDAPPTAQEAPSMGADAPAPAPPTRGSLHWPEGF